MTQANAEFIRGIGLDPELVTDEPVTVMPIDDERVIVNYKGFVIVTPQQLAAAVEAAGARPAEPEGTDG
jgi:hypothetical protein